MFEMILNDMLGVLRATFLGGDWMSLAIAFGSVLIAVLVMRRGTQIGSMTLLALVLFALGGYLRDVFAGPTATGSVTGGRLATEFNSSLNIFMGMTASSLLAYFLAFMLLILVLFGVRALIARG